MKPLPRLALALLALALAFWPLSRHSKSEARRRQLLAEGQPLASHPQTVAVLSSLASEPNPTSGGARLARSLVAEVLAPKADSPENRGRDLARLSLAQRLALEALAADAANWEALLALGAATYLERSLSQDNRLFTEARAWESPLRRAAAIAPGRSEPARFLSLAYLELWQILPPWKREQAVDLLRQGLADPTTFDRLIEPWLKVSGSLAEALALVPDQPLAWQRLVSLYESRRDWQAVAVLQPRFDQALRRDLETRLSDAEAKLKRAEQDLARVTLQHLLEQIPVEGRYAPLFARAFAALPAGPPDSALGSTLASWFVWTVERLELGHEPLPPAVIGRLRLAVGPIDPAQAALAALAAGESPEAERLERLAPRLSAPGWAPYWLARARQEATRGDAARASGYLEAAAAGGELVDSLALLAWQTRAELARRAGDAAGLGWARAEIASHAATNWPSSGWSWRGPVARRELFLASPGRGLQIEILGAPPGGAALDVRWNGAVLATLVAPEPGSESGAWLTLEATLEPGISRLELLPKAGLTLVPGAVRLLP